MEEKGGRKRLWTKTEGSREGDQNSTKETSDTLVHKHLNQEILVGLKGETKEKS